MAMSRPVFEFDFLRGAGSRPLDLMGIEPKRKVFGCDFTLLPSTTPEIIPGSVSSSSPRLNSDSGKEETKTQLTIFYGGKVNVYDNVPADRAHSIMLLAGREAASHADANSPDLTPPESEAIVSRVVSCDTPLVLHQIALSASPPAAAIPMPMEPSLIPSFTATQMPDIMQTQSSANRSPSELPRARKASLARFLVKRKERIQSKAGVGNEEEEEKSNCEGKEKSRKRPFSRACSPSLPPPPGHHPRIAISWEH